MIDPQWIATAGLLAEVPVADGEAATLAQQLGDEREVLPWLLIARRGFAEWPAARAALQNANKAVIRPRRDTSAVPLETRAGASQAQREAAKTALLRALNSGEEADRWTADTLTALRARLTSRPKPNDFIATS